MKIDRKLFEAALQIAKKGISKKADITSKTLVEIKNSGISLVGMNDGMSVITNMPPNSFVFEETEEKKFLVDPSFMMDLLKQLPKSVTEVEFDAENGLVLRYEKSEFKLETIEGADMFPMPTKKGVDENFVTIEANDLRRMVRATAFVSVRKDDSVSAGQEAMKCLAIHCAKDDIKIYAANPYLFSSCLKTHENNGADFNVLIYAEDINEAINAFQNKEIQIFERRWPDIMRDGEEFYLEEAKGILASLLVEIARINRDSGEERYSEGRGKIMDMISRFQDYISDHYMEDLRIDELAEYCHISETHLRRIFTTYMKMSPLEYINTIRIQAACDYLKKTDQPIADVAHKCGFTTNSTFNRNFRQVTGMTPLEWRKRPENYEQQLLKFDIHSEEGW